MQNYKLVNGYFDYGGLKDIWYIPEQCHSTSLHNIFPILKYFYFSWEKSFHPAYFMGLGRKYYLLGYIFPLYYLFLCYLAVKWMKRRVAFNLKPILIYWNLFFALFSLMGSLRIVPHLLHILYDKGFRSTICSPFIWTVGCGPVGIWTIFFVISKMIEIGDTFFIILRKRHLSFLHYYHHASVIFYSWHCFILGQGSGIYFSAMNFSVHTIMYYYYYLSARNIVKPKWGILVTSLQIIQMIIGSFITIFSFMTTFRYSFLKVSTFETGYTHIDPSKCFYIRKNILIGVIVYLSYLMLFVLYFINRYFPQLSKSKLNLSKISKSPPKKKIV